MSSTDTTLARSIVPIRFGHEDRLFGVLNPAAGASDRGVLICAPLGYENVIYHRQLAILARRIAAKGAPTFRFDWPGCGDSAGDDDDPDLIPQSLASIQTAIDVLRGETGVEQVDLVGLRIGATLAGCAIGSTEHSGSLALWDPFPTGKAYLRQLRAFERMSRKPKSGATTDPRESVAGFLLTPETAAGLEALDLLSADYGAPRRILLAHRDGSAEPALAERISAAGHDVTTATLEGLREVALGWAERPVPVDSFRLIENWLGLPETADTGTFDTVGAGGRERSSAVQLESGVKEESVLLTSGSRMLGLTSLPPSEETDGSWVVFVPNRYARRIGPNGLYRRWARSWAEAGLPSFRVDVNGTGDAGGPDGEIDRDMYQPACVDDVVRALDFLRSEYDTRRAAVIGLCSGGYLGFHAALLDETVQDVFLLNPQMLLWADHETGVTLANTLRSRLLRPHAWRRFFQNPITWTRAILPVLRKMVAADLKWRISMRKGRSSGASESIDQWIRRSVKTLGERGCRLHFIFSEGDAGIGYLTRYLGPELRGLADQPHVAIHVVESADHTFTNLALQAKLHDLIATSLASRGYGLPQE